MNLYRIDPADTLDPLWRRLYGEGGALIVAKARAKRLDRNITVSRIDGRTLRVTPIRVISANGEVRRP